MKPVIKLFALFLVIAILFAFLFGLTGNFFDAMFNMESSKELFLEMPLYGWLAGIALLISDIVLPVPATGIMAALGAVYGVLAGTLVSVTGSAAAGLAGYAAGKFLGKRGSRWIATEQELERFRTFFDTWGGYAIILSRIMPLLPEVLTILAGLSRMKFSRFFASLLAGTIPVSLLFVWIGQSSEASPGIGIIVAVIIPAVIWPLFLKLTKL